MSIGTSTRTPPNTTAAVQAPPGLGIRRAPRHLLFGLALMVGFSLLFGLLAFRADPATAVLAIAQPVAAGATITDADLTVVRMVPGPGVQVVAEADRNNVVGRTAAVPLAEGSLLSPTQVGAPAWPPPGESVIAVAVPSGRVPAGVVGGSQVTLLAAPASGEDANAERSVMVSASVVEVAAPDVSGTVVVSLLLATVDARQVALAGGDVSLLLESPGRGR